MKRLGDTWLILLSVVLPSVVVEIIIHQYFSSYISAETSSLCRTSLQRLCSFWRAFVPPSAAWTLPFVGALTFVRFLTFLYWVLSLSYFSHFAVSYISYFAVTIFLFKNSCAFSYYLSFILPDEDCGRNVVNSTVCCSSVCCSLTNYMSILFVLHECRNFFSVAHFGAAIVVFSGRFGAAAWCLNFAFCWNSYVLPLFHLSLLGFVTFVFFTLRC